MNDLLMNPAVQAGAVPFVVAAVLALLLARTRLLVVAVASGALVLLYLTIGFSLEPLTSVRKLIVVTLGASLLAVGLEAGGVSARRPIRGALALAASLGAVWAIQRILVQKEPAAAWLAGLGTLAYVGVLVGGALVAGAKPLRASVIGACLGWGSGALAVLGASALLGQLGIALGTACAAVVLVQMLRGQEAPAGWTTALPAAVGSGLVGVLACATGVLEWHFLLPLLLVAPAAWLVPAGTRKPWQNAFLVGLAALVPVVIAITWALLSAQSTSPAG